MGDGQVVGRLLSSLVDGNPFGHYFKLHISLKLGLKEATGPTGGTQKGECWVAPLMARQPPAVVVPGGERQVGRHRHGPSAYGGDRPLPLGRRRFQCIFF